MIDGRFFFEVFMTLFVIVDPPGTVPIFMALTGTYTAKQRNRAALLAVAVAVAIIVVFAVFGQLILTYMHISLQSLQFAGGLLLLIMALQLVAGKEDEIAGGEGVNIALVPLGTPLLGGPGAIVAVMLFAQQASGEPTRVFTMILALTILAVLIYVFLRFSGMIAQILGEGGVTLVTRIAGVLLAAISTQMLFDAVRTFLQEWGLVAIG